MAYYLFYSYEGYAKTPSGRGFCCGKILGIEEGCSFLVAQRKLYENNPWILADGFDKLYIEHMVLGSRGVRVSAGGSEEG